MGFVEYLQNGFRLIVCRDAIDGQDATFGTFMDQHQLASRLKPVLVPALLHGQPYGFHLPLASG